MSNAKTPGPSYESNSGFPEAYNDSNVNYELSAQWGGYLFVGKCYHPLWDDALRVIFRSQQNAYSTFNVLENYVVLPTIPKAMATYKGYLYVWDDQNTYKINTATMAMEDILEGIGCTGHTAPCATDYGLFWADARTIYRSDGTSIERVGDAVATRSIGVGTSHTELVSGGYTVAIMPHFERNMIAVLYTKSGTQPRAFMWHLKTNAWHF